MFISTLFSSSLCIVNYDSELKLRKISVDPLIELIHNICPSPLFSQE